MAARGQAEQVRQELVQAVKGAQYVQALELCQQCKAVINTAARISLAAAGLLSVLNIKPLSAVLSLQPGDATAQGILAALQEKVQLDAESDEAEDDDGASSEQDRSSSEAEESEDSNGKQASGDEQSEEDSDSVQLPAKTPPKQQCTRLQEAHPVAPGSAGSRNQLKQALKEQIEDLRVQQAAAAMQKLNPLL